MSKADEFLKKHRRVGIDSNLLIALIEEKADYYETVKELFHSFETQKTVVLFSTLSITEILTQPLKMNRPDVAIAYEERLFQSPLTFCDITISTARLASQFGAWSSLKVRDSLIVASVYEQKATGFITADKDFKNLKINNLEVHVIG